MEIKYVEKNSFRIKTKKLSQVTVVVSDEGGVNQVELAKLEGETEKKMIFDRPGEYEVGGVGVVGFRTEAATVFVFHLEGMSVVYLGEFNGELSEKQIDEIGPVDVLLANDKALKLVKSLNPSIVVPFGEEKKIKDLIEKIGVEEVKQDKLSVTKEDLPEETSVIVLG